jgi:DNA-binding beta-propeller fold protein YncE
MRRWNRMILLLCAASLFIERTHPGRLLAAETGAVNTVHRYEYVFPDGFIYVYDIDNGFSLVKTIPVPTTDGVRGSVASAATGKLYIGHGNSGNGGTSTVGKLLVYDLLTDKVLWTYTYPHGIDSMSISLDGRTIYMPTGSGTSGRIWNVIDASTGKVTGSINTGSSGTHNTLVSLNGLHVYMETESSNYLYEANTSNNTIVGTIGPFNNAVRPFTINGNETLVFASTTEFLGFSVGDIATGKVLYTVPIQGFSTARNPDISEPAHGVSLSPDEKELYVVDSINSMVHVFDVSGLPTIAPKQVADLHLRAPMSGRESNCVYSCFRDGWVHHSRDGRYVFVGDSGDVIDTTLHQTVATLSAMANTRKEIEIDFQNGAVTWAMNNRQSIGRVVGTRTPAASPPTTRASRENRR